MCRSPVLLAVASSISTADNDFNVISTARAMHTPSIGPTIAMLLLLLEVEVEVKGITPPGEGGMPPPGWLASRVRPRCLSSRARDRARVPNRGDIDRDINTVVNQRY